MSKARVTPKQAAFEREEPDIVMPEAWRRHPWVPYLIMAAVVAAALGAGLAVQQALKPPVVASLAGCQTSTALGPRDYSGPQPICISAGHQYTATITTSQGQFVIKLLADRAPVTVNNFIVLAVNGYYNGLRFWDAPDWETTGGDPNGNGTGGPGYNLPEEATPDLPWSAGAVGMARPPGGPVNGSQFFVVKGTWPGSGPGAVYNRFGTVTSGIDKVGAIVSGDTIVSVSITVS